VSRLATGVKDGVKIAFNATIGTPGNNILSLSLLVCEGRLGITKDSEKGKYDEDQDKRQDNRIGAAVDRFRSGSIVYGANRRHSY
jgi:hypothetical protein